TSSSTSTAPASTSAAAVEIRLSAAGTAALARATAARTAAWKLPWAQDAGGAAPVIVSVRVSLATIRQTPYCSERGNPGGDVGRGLAWAVVGAPAGGAQHAPTARGPPAGDEHAPAMGPARHVLPAAGRAPAHARCLP